MINLKIKKAAINPERLHADLKAALGEACSGLSYAAGVVTVHLLDGASESQQAEAQAVVEAHNAADLTPAQQDARSRDALPFFQLPRDELVTLAETMDAAAFRREMARAFAYLRDAVRLGRN